MITFDPGCEQLDRDLMPIRLRLACTDK